MCCDECRPDVHCDYDGDTTTHGGHAPPCSGHAPQHSTDQVACLALLTICRAVHGTVNVVRRREIRIWGGGVGQEWVRKRGSRERQQTGGGATQTLRTREPHQEVRGRAQQTRRRGAPLPVKPKLERSLPRQRKSNRNGPNCIYGPNCINGMSELLLRGPIGPMTAIPWHPHCAHAADPSARICCVFPNGVVGPHECPRWSQHTTYVPHETAM